MARKVGGWMFLVLALGAGAWLELTMQRSEHVLYEETTYGMQSDDVKAGASTVAQVSRTQR